MSVTADIPTTVDLLGKTAEDLQENIVIDEDSIDGTLKYVDNYTGFSGDPTEQEGNYIALKATAIDGTTITAELVGGTSGEKTLDADGILIARVTDTTQKIRIKGVYGIHTTEYEYELSGLTLESDTE